MEKDRNSRSMETERAEVPPPLDQERCRRSQGPPSLIINLTLFLVRLKSIWAEPGVNFPREEEKQTQAEFEQGCSVLQIREAMCHAAKSKDTKNTPCDNTLQCIRRVESTRNY
mmetsp:Transcript_12345/g.35298  ORF Transcript_12345/g.35298 Transcript_12345/m.35298 type:complete len:113 (+) Transcript_12345:1089-1427(+)